MITRGFSIMNLQFSLIKVFHNLPFIRKNQWLEIINNQFTKMQRMISRQALRRLNFYYEGGLVFQDRFIPFLMEQNQHNPPGPFVGGDLIKPEKYISGHLQRNIMSENIEQLIARLGRIRQNEKDLDALEARANNEVSTFCDMFWDGYDTLCNTQLSWFSNETDKQNLEKAKKLARVGYDICRDLQKQIKGLDDFKLQEYNNIKQALVQGKPMSIGAVKLFLSLVLPGQLAGVGYTLSQKTPWFNLLVLSLPLMIISGIVVWVYEKKKLINHKNIIQVFLKMEGEVEQLKKLLD